MVRTLQSLPAAIMRLGVHRHHRGRSPVSAPYAVMKTMMLGDG
jgi:hypothetical protein